MGREAGRAGGTEKPPCPPCKTAPKASQQNRGGKEQTHLLKSCSEGPFSFTRRLAEGRRLTEDICMSDAFPGLKGAFVIHSSSELSGCAGGHRRGAAIRCERSALTCISASMRKRSLSSRQGFT